MEANLELCKTDLEKSSVRALLEIQRFSSIITPKGTQEALWRMLIQPFDEMEKRKIIERRKP